MIYDFQVRLHGYPKLKEGLKWTPYVSSMVYEASILGPLSMLALTSKYSLHLLPNLLLMWT